MSITGIFQGPGAMFTELVRISYGFPACRGGSAKCQTCLMFHRPSLTLDLVSAYLETVLSWVSSGLSATHPILSYTVTVLSGRTSQPVMVKYNDTTSRQAMFERKQACRKHYRPDLDTSDQDGKSSSFQLYSWKHLSRKCQECITTSGKQKWARHLQQQTSQEQCSTSRLNFTDPWLIGYEI